MDNSLAVIDLVTAIICLLMVSAAALAMVKRVKLPYTVLLVMIGIALSQLTAVGPPFLQILTEFRISPDVILFVFLPTLIFESAYHLDARQLRRNLMPVLTLAIPGLLLSTAIIGFLIHWLTSIDLAAALLLGAILSATDPVAVIAIFKQLGAPKRLTILIEGESLFNDATAIVAAHILLAIAVAGYVSTETIVSGVGQFVFVFFGGILVGWVLAVATGFLLGRVESDSLIEISLTTILAYFSFLVAEHVLHVSGVMATVAAALTIGGWGRAKISPSVAGSLEHFWEYLAFVANSLIFLLVGLQVDLGALLGAWHILVWTIIAMMIARAVVVYGLVPIAGRLPGAEEIDRRYQTVMYWGGLRGAIALAIALSLGDFRYADTFVAVVTGAVLFTLLVPALSIEWLVNRLGLSEPPLADRLTLLEGRLGALRSAVQRLPGLQQDVRLSARTATKLRTRYQLAMDTVEEDLDGVRRAELNEDEEYRLLLLKCLSVEKAYLHELFSQGHLTERTYRNLVYTINIEADMLRYHDTVEDFAQHTRRFDVLRFAAHWLQEAGLHQLAEKLRLARTARDYENAWAWHHACIRVLGSLDTLGGELATRRRLIDKLTRRYERWRDSARGRIEEVIEQFPEFTAAMQERLADRTLMQAQKEFILQQRRSGAIPSNVANSLLADLDEDIRRLRGLELGRLKLDPEELLRKVPLFMGLSEHEFHQVSQHLRQFTVPAGETFIRRGATDASLYLIARGTIEAYKWDDEKEVVLNVLQSGDFVGESGFLTGAPRNANCRAVTPCAVYELRRSDVDKFRAACPGLDDALAKAARRRTVDVCLVDENGNPVDEKGGDGPA